MKTYTISFRVTGGIMVEAENEDEAINRFNCGEFDEAIGASLAANEVTLLDIDEEDEI